MRGRACSRPTESLLRLVGLHAPMPLNYFTAEAANIFSGTMHRRGWARDLLLRLHEPKPKRFQTIPAHRPPGCGGRQRFFRHNESAWMDKFFSAIQRAANSAIGAPLILWLCYTPSAARHLRPVLVTDSLQLSMLHAVLSVLPLLVAFKQSTPLCISAVDRYSYSDTSRLP